MLLIMGWGVVQNWWHVNITDWYECSHWSEKRGPGKDLILKNVIDPMNRRIKTTLGYQNDQDPLTNSTEGLSIIFPPSFRGGAWNFPMSPDLFRGKNLNFVWVPNELAIFPSSWKYIMTTPRFARCLIHELSIESSEFFHIPEPI